VGSREHEKCWGLKAAMKTPLNSCRDSTRRDDTAHIHVAISAIEREMGGGWSDVCMDCCWLMDTFFGVLVFAWIDRWMGR